MHKAERNWERVTIVCEAAMKSKKGVHFEKLSDYEIIGAHIDGKEAEISDLINNFLQQSGLSTSRIFPKRSNNTYALKTRPPTLGAPRLVNCDTAPLFSLL